MGWVVFVVADRRRPDPERDDVRRLSRTAAAATMAAADVEAPEAPAAWALPCTCPWVWGNADTLTRGEDGGEGEGELEPNDTLLGLGGW